MAFESFAQQFTTLGGRRVFGVPGGGPSLELITQIENAGGAFTATGHEAVAALMAGILILAQPKLLNYIVALYLIIIGLIGLAPLVVR